MKKPKLRAIITILAGSFGMLLFFNQTIPAQQDDFSKLKKKIEVLEEKIEKLEFLLDQYNHTIENRAAGDYGWQNKKNWRRLEIGMTAAQVKKFLGEPRKVIQGIKTLWYYPSTYSGFISFDKNGNITGWHEP